MDLSVDVDLSVEVDRLCESDADEDDDSGVWLPSPFGLIIILL